MDTFCDLSYLPPHDVPGLTGPHITLRAAGMFYAAGQDQQEDWRAWWAAFAREPGIEQLVVERERRFASILETRHGTNAVAQPDHADVAKEAVQTVDRPLPIGELHEAALRDAGFCEVGLIWRTLDDGVLLAVR